MNQRSLRPLANFVAAAAMLLAVQVICPVPAIANNCAPYSAFQSMTLAQLSTLQIRLAQGGASDSLLQPLLITALGNVPDPSQFAACELAGLGGIGVTPVFVSTSQLQAIITDAGTIPAVTAGGASANPFLEFSLANSQPSPTAFAVVLDKPTSASLFNQLRTALAGNAPALRSLASVACSLQLLEPGTPTDVTSGFTVTLSGVRLKRSTGGYVGNLTVANNSGSTPAAPVSVVLSLPTNVTIANADGFTCATTPPGRGFINLTTIPASGSSVMVPIEFENPDLETLTIVSDKVYAGPGAR
jgi:hypothetical protein